MQSPHNVQVSPGLRLVILRIRIFFFGIKTIYLAAFILFTIMSLHGNSGWRQFKFDHLTIEDGKGNVWKGNRTGGLERFDRDNNRSIHFRHYNEEHGSLSHNHVTKIIEELIGLSVFCKSG